MSILSGFAKGFLSLLDSQNFGQAPKELSDVVVPTVEMSDLYLLSKQVGAVSVFAAPANGPNTGQGLIVPLGEVWRVHTGGAQVITGVGVTLDIAPTVVPGAGQVPLANTISVLASQTRFVPMVASPFWLPAGGELTAYISSLVGVPSVSIAYMVSKLRA